jgi:hypothetical protein
VERKGYPLLSACFVLAVGVGLLACGGVRSESTVARIGNAMISQSKLEHWMGVRVHGSYGSRTHVLGFLIFSRWTEGEARALGVRVSDKEAERQLEVLEYAERQGFNYEPSHVEAALQRSLAGNVTHSDKVWLMKLSVLATRIQEQRSVNARRAISSAQIANYYEHHKSQFVAPERRDVTWLVTYSEASIRKAMREVRRGKSLLGIAERLSLDPPTIKGMEYAAAKEKDFAGHVFKARPHVPEGPFRQSENHYVIEVTGVTPARQKSLAEAEASIRSVLAEQQQPPTSASLASVFQSRWTAVTTCRAGYVVPGCREYGGPPTAVAGRWP